MRLSWRPHRIEKVNWTYNKFLQDTGLQDACRCWNTSLHYRRSKRKQYIVRSHSLQRKVKTMLSKGLHDCPTISEGEIKSYHMAINNRERGKKQLQNKNHSMLERRLVEGILLIFLGKKVVFRTVASKRVSMIEETIHSTFFKSNYKASLMDTYGYEWGRSKRLTTLLIV